MIELTKEEAPVLVFKEDIGTTCDIAELIFQHSNEGTKKLIIELPNHFKLNDFGKNFANWKEKLLDYADYEIPDFEDITFEIEELNHHLIIIF